MKHFLDTYEDCKEFILKTSNIYKTLSDDIYDQFYKYDAGSPKFDALYLYQDVFFAVDIDTNRVFFCGANYLAALINYCKEVPDTFWLDETWFVEVSQPCYICKALHDMGAVEIYI